MTPNPTVVATARCNLVRRMDRYLDTVEKAGKVFGLWEIDLLCRALGYLEMGYYQAGEVAMLQAEQADLYCSQKTATLPRGPWLTVAEVRARMARVLEGVLGDHDPRPST